MQQLDLLDAPRGLGIPLTTMKKPEGVGSSQPQAARKGTRADYTAEPSTDQRGMRSTSRDGLADHKETGKLGAQQQAVFSVLTRTGMAFTRAELAKQLGMTHGAACGRINELMKLHLVVETERRVCSVTGANSHGVRAR